MTCAHTARCTFASSSYSTTTATTTTTVVSLRRKSRVLQASIQKGGGETKNDSKTGQKKSMRQQKAGKREKSKPSTALPGFSRNAHAQTHAQKRQLIGSLCWRFSKLDEVTFKTWLPDFDFTVLFF